MCKGFIGFRAELQFTLPIGKLRSTAFMAGWQRGSFRLLANQPSGVWVSNYAIKRDLRENTRFKFIIGRVGPLFWLLEP